MAFLKDLIDSFLPAAYAEEPVDQSSTEEREEAQDESTADESGESSETTEEASGDDEEEEDEDEEDEDEDEEEADPLDKLREQCAESKPCHHFKHHFEECVERVTKEMEEEGYEHKHYKENCVEEFFHLQHCVNDCAAPKLFYKLK